MHMIIENCQKNEIHIYEFLEGFYGDRLNDEIKLNKLIKSIDIEDESMMFYVSQNE